MHNVHIDLPSISPHLAAKGFWGGSSTTFCGIRPVNMVMIPSLIAGAAIKPTLQENTNLSLNMNSSPNNVSLAMLRGLGKPAPFDSFVEPNPFTMKMLDPYVSICQVPLLALSDCHVVQVSYAAVDLPCTATHLYSAAPPTVCFAIAPTTHRPCGQLHPHYFTTTPSLCSSSLAQTLPSLGGKHHVILSCFAPIYPTPHLHIVGIISGSILRMSKLGSEYTQVLSGAVHLTDHPVTAYYVHLASIFPGFCHSSATHSCCIVYNICTYVMHHL
jgi:hypothetical protein